MEEEKKSVFEETAAKEIMPGATINPEEDKEVLSSTEKEDDFIIGELQETEIKLFILSDEDDNEDNKKEFVIESVELMKPITKNVDGVIEPLKSNGKKYYQTKLKILYKDTDYASYIPNIKWYLGLDKEGKKTLTPWFRLKCVEEDLKDNFTPEITKMYYRFCNKFDIEVGKLTRNEFVDQLVGKKVILKNTSGKYNGKTWNRIDIKSF
ncbi:MAG: hypothetical protein KAX49_14445 [Halanaerobiales bacterium]|nr:hypothetical protein [Halanaerobiales bacterium]